MSALGDAFWSGREERIEKIIIDLAPAHLCPPMADWSVKSGQFRDGGMGFKRRPLEQWTKTKGPYFHAWRYAMETNGAATECADRAAVAVERLGDVVKTFMARVKNDTSAMKHASERVQSEVAQMGAKYKAAADLLTSEQFERAIANAERMAAALEAIGRLQQTTVKVAVFGGPTGG